MGKGQTTLGHGAKTWFNTRHENSCERRNENGPWALSFFEAYFRFWRNSATEKKLRRQDERKLVLAHNRYPTEKRALIIHIRLPQSQYISSTRQGRPLPLSTFYLLFWRPQTHRNLQLMKILTISTFVAAVVVQDCRLKAERVPKVCEFRNPSRCAPEMFCMFICPRICWIVWEILPRECRPVPFVRFETKPSRSKSHSESISAQKMISSWFSNFFYSFLKRPTIRLCWKPMPLFLLSSF